MPEPLVSIIVPTLNRPQQLDGCLESIEATVNLPHEVICVWVEGDAATREVIERRGVKQIVQPTRMGFVKAANAGFRAATGEYVTQINDDCTLMPHTIANAIRFLEVPARDRIGLAAFFHDSPVKRNIFAEITVEDTRFVICHVRGLCYANFGIARRSLYDQLGYFDERYFMYGADPDFSLKVWHEAKMIVAPCPGALIRHAELTDERGAIDRAQQDDDNRKLFEKWDLD